MSGQIIQEKTNKESREVLKSAAVLGALVDVLLSFTTSYRSLPVNKQTEPVNLVSETWKDRPKSNMVKWLMRRSGVSPDKIAKYLGCSVNYLNNKLSRDSFSLDDLIIISYACGYTFVLLDNNEESTSANSFRIDLLEYFNADDNDDERNKQNRTVLDRISKLEAEKKATKRAEYERKKAELERMKVENGFED